MNSIRAGVAFILALGASGAAYCAVLGPVVRTIANSEWSTSGFTPVPFVLAFDPALGALRCKEIIVGQDWGASGVLCVIRSPHAGGGGTVSGTLQASVTLGYFDGTGFTGLASDLDTGGSVSLTYPAGSGVYCGTTFGGGGSHATKNLLIGSQQLPGGMYAGHNAGFAPTFPLPIGASPIVQNASSFKNASFAFYWHYTPAVPCHGDVNSDGVVDFLDLNSVLASYAETGPCSRGDVNNDNTVDFLDLNEILSYYGLACAAAATPMGVTPPPSASTR